MPASAIPPPGQCDPDPPPSPDAAPGQPEPDPYPSRPTRLTRETVTAFLARYEEAYQRNAELVWVQENDACVDDLGANVGTGQATVWPAGDGYGARVKWASWIDGAPCPGTGTDTATPVPQSYRTGETDYFITAWVLIRNGTVVECWEPG